MHAAVSKTAEARALTVVEVLVVVVCIGVLAVVGWGFYAEGKSKQKYLTCVMNLKQIAFASNQFEIDAGERGSGTKRSTMLSTNLGGSLEFIGQGQAFQHFLALSNYLSVKRLACPTDARTPAMDWSQFSNRNLSYFLAVEFAEPTLLAGDRHLESQAASSNGVLTLTRDVRVSWGKDLHWGKYGVVGLADGSATAWGSTRFQTNIISWADRQPSNLVRLEFP